MTQGDKALLAVIRDWQARHGRAPSQAEMMGELRIKSKAQLQRRLARLLRAGEIRQAPGARAGRRRTTEAVPLAPGERLELARLKAALRFYASAEVWRREGGQPAAVFRDKGLRARHALEGS